MLQLVNLSVYDSKKATGFNWYEHTNSISTSKTNSRVFCLSDNHAIKDQKKIRAAMIKDIQKRRGTTGKPMLFLVEGTALGLQPNKKTEKRLIGRSLHNNYVSVGWDNSALVDISLIYAQKITRINRKINGLDKEISALRSEQGKLFIDLTKSETEIDDEFENIDKDIKKLRQKKDRLSLKSDKAANKVSKYAIDRNDFLYKAIRLANKHFKGDIFVIAGGKHLEGMQEKLKDIDPTVIQLRKPHLDSNTVTGALEELYGTGIPRSRLIEVKA